MTNQISTESPVTLQSTFAQLMAFRPMQANDLLVSEDIIKLWVEKESASGKIMTSAGGLTPGMKQNILNPGRDFLARWEKVKSPFDTQITPFLHDIESLEKIGGEIERLEKHKDKKIEQIKLRAEADRRFLRARDEAEQAEARYKSIKSREGGREANTGAYNFFYWPAILMIGVTEWLINYDTFFSFLSVPAIAAGATVILGVLLAFAAHAHGTLLKQWSYLFGHDQTASDRRNEWRLLALATFSLLLVLAAAGGARYESAIRVVVHLSESASGINVLGTDATIESSPMRDVLLSLLANVAAWAVGVFLAYLAHDKNRDFMKAAKTARDTEKVFQKLHKKYIQDEKQTEEAKVSKGTMELDASAKDRRINVEAEHAMWKAAKEREADVNSVLSSVLKHNLDLYKDALAGVTGIKIFVDGRELSAQEFHQRKLNFVDDLSLTTEKG